METCKNCKFCFGKPKPCLLELAGVKPVSDEVCENYLARDLYKWVHARSVELLQGGFELVGDNHDGTTHKFRFMRGDDFIVIREIVYNTSPKGMWGKVLNDKGRQFDNWVLND